jgi:hypothetical protein
MAEGTAEVSTPSWKRVFSTVCAIVLLLGTLVTHVGAQSNLTDPIDLDSEVTATVPYLDAPPVPILITPTNNSVISSGLVEFAWYEVTGHPFDIDHYQIHVNGQVLYTLSAANQETTYYSLKLENGVYRLTLKSPGRLVDGSYTWKISVHDVLDRGTDSATWQFTVDSSQPPVIVTDIDGQQVSISASDPDTIPVDPVIVYTSTPFIYGSTEPLAEVQLVVLRADGSESHYKMTATSDGHFLFYLPQLNPNEIVGLTITAIDIAGNNRVLTGLRLQYVPRRIVIPLPDFIPDQPDIVIPIPDIPGLEPQPPVLPTPDPSRPGTIPLEPGQQIYSRPVTYLGAWRWLLVFFLFGYTLWVFWWTGNVWWRYFQWMGQMLGWWLLWPDGESIATTRTGASIPWVPLSVEWLEKGGKFQRRLMWTSAGGFWRVPSRFLTVATLASKHRHWLWIPLESKTVSLSGYTLVKNLTLVRPDSLKGSGGDATPISPQGRLWVTLGSDRASNWRWRLRWWPRIWLIATLLVAAWLAYRVPVQETFLWGALVIWMLIRDVQGRLPERWRAWKDTV